MSNQEIKVFNRNIPELDGLRAIAIIMVMFRHIFLYIYFINGHKPILPVFGYDLLTLPLNGWVGVDLFFVLSGYLISSQFLKGHPVSVHKYAAKRILRIVPAYFFVMLICVLGLFPYFKVEAGSNIWQSMFFHAILLNDYTGSDINGVFWSLAVEEKFYIVVPFIVWFLIFISKTLRHVGVFVTIFLMILLGIYLRISILPYEGSTLTLEQFLFAYRHPFHCCIEPFVFGILISYIRYRCKPNPKLNKLAPTIFYSGLFLGMVLFLSHVLLNNINGFDVIIQPTLISFIMFLVVFGAVMGGGAQFLKNGFLSFISRISYSLYLVHWPVYPSALI